MHPRLLPELLQQPCRRRGRPPQRPRSRQRPRTRRRPRSVGALSRRRTATQPFGTRPAAGDALAASLGRGPDTAGGRSGCLAGLDDLQTLVAHSGDDHRDVAGPLVDPARPSPSAGTEALERRTLVGVAGHDEEFLDVLAVVVHGVGDGAGEHLADLGGGGAVGELQHLVGPADIEAADQVENGAGLGGRAAQVLGGGPRRDPSVELHDAVIELQTSHALPPTLR